MTFLESLPPFGPERDAFLLRCIAGGRLDVPQWVPVTMGRVRIQVSRDYLSIDGERCPMPAPVAQAACDSLDALLPTPAIVDAIEEEPSAIVTWLPTQPPSAEMTSAAAFARCERETWEILQGHLGSDIALLAGHRKDVVIAPWMPVGKVVLYGARWPDGRRLQPLYPAQGSMKGHLLDWADYAQGVRAVRRQCLFDGKPALLDDVLRAGHCGGVVRLRYPTPERRRDNVIIQEGIDVSGHQDPPLNLGGVDFLIVRVTMGASGIDDHGRTHLQQGATAGLEVLVAYHFLRGDSSGEAQARHFLSHVAAIDHEIGYVGLMVDCENLDAPKPPWHIPKYRQFLLDFLAHVRAATSRRCLVYGPGSYLPQLTLPDEIADMHPLMLADWTPPAVVPKPWKKWTIHQYKVDVVDRDRFEGPIAELRCVLGLDRVSLADMRLGEMADTVRRATGRPSAETFVEVDEGPVIKLPVGPS